MTTQEQYRIRECNGVFTIQKKRFIEQRRLFSSRMVEQWEDVDENGIVLNNIMYRRRKETGRYTSLKQAKKAMDQFIQGVRFHYPSDNKPPCTNSTIKL